MGRKSTKKNKNIYQLLREEVGLTREQAEEALEYISSDRIEKIEADKVIVRPDEVLTMANAYKKPELINYYCSHECPIGQKYVPPVNEKQLSQITLEILDKLNDLEKIKEKLIEITVDGIISEDEINDFTIIKKELAELKNTIDSLTLWAEKQNINV